MKVKRKKKETKNFKSIKNTEFVPREQILYSSNILRSIRLSGRNVLILLSLPVCAAFHAG